MGLIFFVTHFWHFEKWKRIQMARTMCISNINTKNKKEKKINLPTLHLSDSKKKKVKYNQTFKRCSRE